MSGMDRKIEKKGFFNRKNILIGSGILVFLAFLAALIFSDKSSKLNVEEDKISIEAVENGIFQDYIAVIGSVEPIQTIYLDATEGGRVEQIFIREGTMLKKGDVILQLSNDNLLLEISQYETEVARAVNDLKTMRVNLENQRISNKNLVIDLYYDLLKLKRQYIASEILYKDGHISKEEFDVAHETFERNDKHYALILEKSKQDSVSMNTTLASSKESVESMQQNLGLVRNRLGKLIIKAPVNGELASLKPEVGEVITYGTRIGTVNILDSYKLRVEIDEHFISRIVKGLKGECDFSEVNYPAIITKVFPEVQNGRFSVDMEFTGKVPGEIRIGQTSRIRLELGESKNALLLPKGGFYQSTGGQWVFVVDKTGTKAIKRDIRIGRQNPKYYEILEGLTTGEKVITSSYENFGTADKLILKKGSD